MKQQEILDEVESFIPRKLWKRFTHLSFAEMAEQPEFAEYRDELLQAESDWYTASDA